MSKTDPDAPQDGVSGLVERVTFHNEETGFAVLRVKVKAKRDLLTVVGSVASISAGEWIVAQGRWIHEREHGLQLRADFIKCSPPSSREGIEKYLGSGMIKGIGPVYAKKLVDKFGEQIFTIIEQYSVRLEEVEGVGPGRRKKIKEAWAQQKVIREIMVFLHSHGLSTSRAVRIYKTYGEEAIERIRANPYTLAKDIHGIGFKSADAVAQKMGIPLDSIIRARAGVVYSLAEATGEGHCALPKEILLGTAKEILQVEKSIVAEALERMLLDGEVVHEDIAEWDLIYLPALRWSEEGIASLLVKVAGQKSTYPPFDSEKAIQWVQQKTGKELALSQVEALKQALRSRVLVITGGPGVGKTTLVHSILLVLRAKKIRCLLCAPTGRAAKRLSETTGLEAKTIHRLLEFQPKTGGFSYNTEKPLICDLLVVDETSMLDVPLMHKLLQALPPRAHLLLVGDVDQLPSVGPGSVLGDIIRSKVVQVIRLTEIFRQAARSRIITNAHKINTGKMPELENSDPDCDFFFVERDEPELIQSTILEMVQNRIPKKLQIDPITEVQVLCPMNRGNLGTREINYVLQTKLNPLRHEEPIVEKYGTQFRIRDKVIQTENNYDKEVFNGDIGQVTCIDPDEREVEIQFDGRPVIYDFNELDEVSLAYAISIHKSQGSEFPVVVIPLATQHYMLLQRNLLYTAITRGKKLVVIVGQKKALGMSIRNIESSKRFSGLYDRLIGKS